jgi:rRNA-processing protein FCF1
MQYLILDTSSILFATSNKRDIFESVKEYNPEHAPLISRGIMSELKRIGDSEKGKAKFAAAALYLIKEHQPDIVNNNDDVDGWILAEAEKRKCDVCTNDIALKKALKSMGIQVFSISRDGRLR